MWLAQLFYELRMLTCVIFNKNQYGEILMLQNKLNTKKTLSGTAIRSVSIFFTSLSLSFCFGGAFAQDYSESPMLADHVSNGNLPAIAERLPINPAVMVPLESIGDYTSFFIFSLSVRSCPQAPRISSPLDLLIVAI